MSEAIYAHWEITRAKNAGTKPNPHGGTFDKYYIGLDNLDGGDNCEDAYWQRKNPSEVKVGDKVYGKLEKGDYGWRFFLEPEPDGSPGASRGSSEAQTGSKGSWQPESERDPERAARILRQHSQGCAVQVLCAQGIDGVDQAMLRTAIREWTDWFDEDVHRAGVKAVIGQTSNQAQGSAPPAQVAAATSHGGSPGSDSVSAEEQQKAERQVEDALDSAGVVSGDERQWLAKAWREMAPKDGLTGEERKAICLTSLSMGDSEVQAGALTRLRELAGSMPDSFKTSDLPFHHPEYSEVFCERERWRF